jgi:hypothetical protein
MLFPGSRYKKLKIFNKKEKWRLKKQKKELEISKKSIDKKRTNAPIDVLIII